MNYKDLDDKEIKRDLTRFPERIGSYRTRSRQNFYAEQSDDDFESIINSYATFSAVDKFRSTRSVSRKKASKKRYLDTYESDESGKSRASLKSRRSSKYDYSSFGIDKRYLLNLMSGTWA